MRKSAHPDKSRRAKLAASNAERPAAARARHADFLARILARKSARKSVSVLWNLAILNKTRHVHDNSNGYENL